MGEPKKDETLGKILKQTRLEKNLSLEDIHRKTKIPLKFLQTIEEDEIPDMDAIYVRGLIKIYCNFLGLNYREILEKFPIETKKEPQKESILFSSSKVRFKIYRISSKNTIIIIFIIVGIIFISNLFKNMTKKPAPILKEMNKHAPQVTLPQTLESPKEKISPSVSNQMIRIRLYAKQDCWVKAIVDGRVVFQSILKKGRFQAWEAKESLELSLGNAGGVELYINEKPFSTLGKSGQVIRKILINQEGLKVLR
jgi:transcriptional regulator with XRE-family HTH domain